MYPFLLPTPPPTVPSTRKQSPIVNFTINCSASTPVTPPFIPHNPFDVISDSPSSSRSGGDKRRRTRGGQTTSNSGSGPGQSPKGDSAPTRGRPPPIKPVGFAAGRESRRQSDGFDPSIPSPVIMGFDYKTIDAEQLKTVSAVHQDSKLKSFDPRLQRPMAELPHSHLHPYSTSQPLLAIQYQSISYPSTAQSSRAQTPAGAVAVAGTGAYSHSHPPRHSMQFPFPGMPTKNQAEARQVRETISIREQQQALIAQRRREALELNPPEPVVKEMTFKAWQHPNQKERSVPGHDQRSSQAGGLLTVNTGHSDKDIMMASRVSHLYPLNQSCGSQADIYSPHLWDTLLWHSSRVVSVNQARLVESTCCLLSRLEMVMSQVLIYALHPSTDLPRPAKDHNSSVLRMAATR